jgi:hypothetical protein
MDSTDTLKRFDFERARGLLYSVKNKDMAIAAAKWIAQQLPLGTELFFFFFFFNCFFKLFY